MREWASAGAAGDPPAPDMARRRELAERQARAQAAAVAAKGAAATIQNELAGIPRELAAIDDAIEAAALEIIADEDKTISTELEAATQAFAGIVAKFYAPARTMGELGRALISNGREAAGAIWLRRAEAMGNLPQPDPWPDPDVIDAARAEWNSRFRKLIG